MESEEPKGELKGLVTGYSHNSLSWLEPFYFLMDLLIIFISWLMLFQVRVFLGISSAIISHSLWLGQGSELIFDFRPVFFVSTDHFLPLRVPSC